MKILRLNQRGDTIVEVLIAMVILAFVLTGAYESAQYSLNNIVNAEHRITALNIASSQIEALKKVLSTTTSTTGSPIFSGGNFYLNSSGTYSSGVPATVTDCAAFYYEFEAPVHNTANGADDYTFSVNVYWRNLTFNPLANSCSKTNLKPNCDALTLSYQAGV